MLGKTVLLWTGDRRAARRLTCHLRGAGNDVVAVADARAAADLVCARAVDLALVDGDDRDGARAVLDAARGAIPAVVLSATGDADVLLDFVCAQGVEHVLARADGADDGDGDGGALDELAREVVVTTEKLLRGELFGLDKYLPGFGLEITTAPIRGATDRDEVLDCLRDHLAWLGAGREACRAAAVVADELITNAVYDAPRDPDGHPRYAATDRRTKIELEPWEHASISWASDGDVLALAVTDWFGALTTRHIRDGLRRCLGDGDPIEHKPGGAGLGLYTALAHARQLVVNVEVGARTEIIALIDLRRRAAGARRGGRSLHVFVDDPAARADAPCDATPESVEVSESLRLELRTQLAVLPPRATIIPLARRKPTSSLDALPRAVRARGSSSPPVGDPVGAGTACGLLRGARAPDAAIQIALRFLARHYHTAVAFEVEARRLQARASSGAIADWPRLCDLRIGLDGPASLVSRGTDRARDLRAGCPLDYRLAMLTAGDSEAWGLSMPLSVAGELRWVLYGAAPRLDAPVGTEAVETVRRELELCLRRVDPEEPVIEISLA
ncbi:MAG: hypothetical protein H6709_07885 [Kofleriaceae bacterium]|nr:hypothetical protein [Kofleriaceae bacterium]